MCVKGVEVVQDVEGGVLVSEGTLVLQSVSRGQAGSYTCHARNAMGQGHSNTLTLDVKCEFL